ncbi:GntR family transcriptional regulator [Paracoccus sp. (in: a-proteobacteria)]|uniref:GntR family transcriptional regulator n=1 Tax=Paracoccus sp. TaxID=267 RepID=UPI0035B0AD92
MLQRTKSSPLAQQVYDRLIGDIAARRRQPGDRLVEAVIARDTDVSRTPVREALGRLENDGLIESTRPSGYIVVAPSLEDVREIFEIRRALEPVAFAGVVANAEAADDDEFRRLFDAVQAAQSRSESAAANVAFRSFWVSRIRNGRLRETLLRYHLQVQLVRAATLHSAEGRAAARAGTVRLADAYLSRDAEAARLAMAAFVDAALVFFERADTDRFPHLDP